MTPDAWDRIVGSEAPADVRADEACPCVDLLTESVTLEFASLEPAAFGDSATASRLMAESNELRNILGHHIRGLVSTEALLDWKHAREEQNGAAS